MSSGFTGTRTFTSMTLFSHRGKTLAERVASARETQVSGSFFVGDLRPTFEARPIWIADAHRDDGKRSVVHADEKLTAFLELESVIRGEEDTF
jgi:hypothetical protein